VLVTDDHHVLVVARVGLAGEVERPDDRRLAVGDDHLAVQGAGVRVGADLRTRREELGHDAAGRVDLLVPHDAPDLHTRGLAREQRRLDGRHEAALLERLRTSLSTVLTLPVHTHDWSRTRNLLCMRLVFVS